MDMITVRVEDWINRELLAEAAERGIDQSDVVREAIVDHLRGRSHNIMVSTESSFEIASRIGLIGCAEGLPPDLSTNRAYLDGFGQ
jgi:hypothetical protein